RKHVGGVVFLVEGLVANDCPAGGLDHLHVQSMLAVETHGMGHDDRRGAGDRDECARQSWCDPAGGSPAQVRSGVRLVASVAWPLATVVAKRTQRLHGVWD